MFSKPEVAARVTNEFIPVALKAGTLNNPPRNAEGRLYRELGRTKPAPQGICVANSAGKALCWALSFDDEASIGKFLDHATRRFQELPDATKPVATQRYMKFPSHDLGDVADSGLVPEIPAPGARGRISEWPAVQPGTVLCRVVGRVIGTDGKPVKDVASQENYIEDLIQLDPRGQEQLAERLVRDADRAEVPHELAKAIVARACLGQLDVMPRWNEIDARMHVQPVSSDRAGTTLLELTGTSEFDAGTSGRRGDGARFHHAVQLKWRGFLEMKARRITDIVLTANGRERLRWGNRRLNAAGSDVERLMAGRAIDKECDVRYGIVGKPAPAERVSANARPGRRPQARGARVSDTVRRKMQRVQQLIGRNARDGRPPRRVTESMARFHRARQSGRAQEAERILDEILARLEGPGGRNRSDGPPQGIQRRLDRLHRRIQELLQRGEVKRAERLLDESLKLFEKGG